VNDTNNRRSITMASQSQSNLRSDVFLRYASEDDSIESGYSLEQDDDEDVKGMKVRISGLELLSGSGSESQNFSNSSKTDDTNHGDESDRSMSSIEVDSLILARKRLPHLRYKRRQKTELESGGLFIEGDYIVPLGMPLCGARKRITGSDQNTDTTSSDSGWDSLTVDSLILTRRRFALTKSAPRRMDSILLTRRRMRTGKGTRSNKTCDIQDGILDGACNMHDVVRKLDGHKASLHVHYNPRLSEIESMSKPNNGGINCAA
jgi:hypothetical protein